ncbi:MAG: pilus assembly protein PilN [Burkholderiales bacterium]|nr:pilus assembly protein PilN [Burkholderiales bacterium]
MIRQISPSRFLLLPLATALGALSLSGCAGVDQARIQQAQIKAQAEHQFASMPPAGTVVQIDRGAWLLGEEVAPTAPKPALLGNLVDYASPTPPTLAALAQWIEANTGVEVVVDPSALPQSAAPGGSVGASLAATGLSSAVGGQMTSIPPVPSSLSTSGGLPSPAFAGMPSISGATALSTSGGDQDGLGPLRYSGALSGFLDMIATRFGDFWRFKDGRITIFKTETKTFELPALPAAFEINGSISSTGTSSSTPTSAGGGSGSNSGSQVSMSQSGKVDQWTGLQKMAQAVGGPGASVIVDRNLDMLTATGTPAQIQRVTEWVSNLDTEMSKQIVVDVRMYNVTLTAEDNYGLNLSLAYKGASGHTGISVTGAQVPTITGNSTPMSFTASILGGTLDGTSAAVQALSSLGKVSQVQEVEGIALNGDEAGLQNATIKGYVPNAQTTVEANAGAMTTMQTATAVGGITGAFLPRAVGGKILINFHMQLTDLLPFQQVSSNGSLVQLINEIQATLLNSVSLKSGQSLVMVGNRTSTANLTNTGVGNPNMALLGGGVDAQRGDTVLAVVITARLL